jgi:hypothetical protein
MDLSVKVIPRSQRSEIAGYMADGTLADCGPLAGFDPIIVGRNPRRFAWPRNRASYLP